MTERLVRISVSVMCVATAACSGAASNERSQLRIAGGPRQGTFFILANALASAYTAQLPDVSAEAVETRASTDNINAVEIGAAECGIGAADYLYNARSHGTVRLSRPHERLRGVAVLYPNTLHVITRADSGLVKLSDLAGKRMTGAFQSDSLRSREEGRMEAIASAIADLSAGHRRPILVPLAAAEAVGALGEHRIEAANFYGGPPYSLVAEAARAYAINILEFDDLATSMVKAKYPFLKPATIPAGTYPGQDKAVRTVAVDNVLMCSADLAPELVYRLTRSLYEQLGAIAAVHPAAREIDPENGASTPIPLHEGAARYYRERELFR